MKKNEQSFKGKLGSYTILPTEDNTRTVYSEYFDEACHNLSGAYAETVHNYIQGCRIPDLFAQNISFSVLDVGFGVGIGLKALRDEKALHPEFSATVTYYSIELDEDFFLWSAKETFPELNFARKMMDDLVWFEASGPQIRMVIFIGDGRSTLPFARKKGLVNPLDAIFQDPFSPKKNPALWSVEWFTFLKEIASREVRLSTYSSSISIRKSLIEAGWTIVNDKGFALKRTMTKANLMGITAPELLDQLARSPSKAIRDQDIT